MSVVLSVCLGFSSCSVGETQDHTRGQLTPSGNQLVVSFNLTVIVVVVV